jgi:hypothetical protein
MTERTPLDDLTSDQLDALYRELEHTHLRARTLVQRLTDVKAERDSAKAAVELVRARAQQWQVPMPRGERNPAAHQILALLGEPGPAATEATEAATTTRVLALYEQWVQAGWPPLGTPLSRWWDARLAELHDAILPRTDHTSEQPCINESSPRKSPAPSPPGSTPTP